MKRINNLILALAGLFAVACADTFEERYDLAVNTDRYSVTAEAGKLPVTVYCSGAWTAQLTAESAWATLDRTAGSGITTIRLNYADNPGLTRSVGVVLRGSGLEKTVTVVQKAGITAPELIFLSKDLAFANGAYKGTAAFETNLPDELLRDVVPAVTYAAEGDAWISDVVYHADDAEAGETEIPLARRGLITFATAANATGEPRTATVGFSVTDADGNVFGDSFTVTQSADEARITLADDVAPIEGGRRAVAFSTNLGALLAEMKVEVTYADPAVADFISDVELGAGELTYAITANEGVEKRYATITVSCADLAGGVVSASSNITQRVTAQPREVSSADLRALFTAEDKSYASDEDHIDYLLCRVIGDAGNPNMDQNLNTGPNSITTDENDCTNYVQSLDGRYGFRLKFAAPADNVCLRGEQVKILLDGVTLSRESDPMRYTLRGLKAGNIEKAAEASALEPKARTIATLTDDDIYTYVTLKDVEFPVRKGAITPLNEGYAIGTGADRISKYPLLVRDINGDDMYMLTNTNCAYRSDGTRLPYGSGKISGVIVHERFSRFEWRDGADPAEMDDDPTLGFIGRYQIRHQTKGDIWDNMQNSVEDGFSALLTEYRYWNPDLENKVQKPTYGTNGYLTHTYQEKYTGSASKEYLQATFQQHMWGGGTYEYLGPVGNNASYIFGANFGNKNGIGVVIDPAKESWNPLMDDLVSRNPDGTLEWCGPYAKDKNAANGTGGWPGNNEIATNSTQINYNGSTGMRGKGNVYGSCYTAFANHFWWDDDTDRPYAWLINFSTEGITTSHISMQISVMNTQQSFFSPRFWCAEWSLTDSQAAKDDSQWNLIGEYTIPDVSVWANTLYSSCVAYKSIDFELPQEILGHENVYIRLRPTSDLCSDGSDYANARLNQSASGAALAAEHASSLEYFAIRYNK